MALNAASKPPRRGGFLWKASLVLLVIPPAAFAGILYLSQYSATAETISFYVYGSARSLVLFPQVVAQKHERCTMAEAWSENAFPTRAFATRRDLSAKSRLLETDGGLALYSTPHGDYWIPAGDVNTLYEMIGDQQRAVYSNGVTEVRTGDIVLDCGANVGVFTREALARGAKQVVAIEPAPGPIECLRRNLRDEIASGRVILYEKGVWNREDLLELSAGPGLATAAGSVALDRGGSAGPVVPLTTIDILTAELGLESVDFIKMDIEGAEPQAIEGAVETIRKFQPRMALALEHRPTDPDDIPAQVGQLFPTFHQSLSPCAILDGRLQPEILFVNAN